MLTRRFNRALLILAGVTSLVTTAFLWTETAAHQEMWPLPGLYFIEVVLLPGLAVYFGFDESTSAAVITWAIVGAMLGFVLIGALSVGFFYLPAVLFLGVGAALGRHDRAAHYFLGIGVALLAAMAQVGMMLLLIRLLYPDAAF
jgi:hypothetical protein